VLSDEVKEASRDITWMTDRERWSTE